MANNFGLGRPTQNIDALRKRAAAMREKMAALRERIATSPANARLQERLAAMREQLPNLREMISRFPNTSGVGAFPPQTGPFQFGASPFSPRGAPRSVGAGELPETFVTLGSPRRVRPRVRPKQATPKASTRRAAPKVSKKRARPR